MIRTALTAALFSLTAACGGQAQDESSPSDSGLTVSAEHVVLFPDDPGRMRIGDLRYTGGVELSSTDERFGGWSGWNWMIGRARSLFNWIAMNQ
jgi:hypothetical protein